MRNIGLVSAAVIAMAAMAGTVAAAAPPVIEPHRQNSEDERERLSDIEPHRQNSDEDLRAMLSEQMQDEILAAVRLAELDGLSGEAAQQRIRDLLQIWVRGGIGTPNHVVALRRARLLLINRNRLRRGSDGDLAVSALLAAREAGSPSERSSAGRNRYSGGSLEGGGGLRRGDGRSSPREEPVAVQGSPTAGGAGRNVPGNAAAGQPATDAGTTGIRRSRATYDPDVDDEYDPDLDDEAGEPD